MGMVAEAVSAWGDVGDAGRDDANNPVHVIYFASLRESPSGRFGMHANTSNTISSRNVWLGCHS